MRYINIPYYFLSIFVNLPKAKLNYYGIRGLARVLEMYMLKKKVSPCKCKTVNGYLRSPHGSALFALLTLKAY